MQVYREFTFHFEETEVLLVKLTVCRHLQEKMGFKERMHQLNHKTMFYRSAGE